MAGLEHRSLNMPDETRPFEHGKTEIANLGEFTVGRNTLQPGWRWSQDVKPIVGTEWCEQSHLGYHVSGTLHVRMKDGTEYDLGPDEVTYVPAGHDAWVVGNDPVILIDFVGAMNYARAQAQQ